MRRMSVIAGVFFIVTAALAEPVPVTEVIAVMKRAAQYMDENVATQGGYLWRYTADLKQRWGEGKASDQQVWVQSGTPMMGMAYLDAYKASGDTYFLELAKKAADALVWGQLECGGWYYHIDFSEAGPRKLYYRHMKGREDLKPGERYNHGIFDDNTTQSAMRLLMRVDRAVGFEGPYHEATMAGLEYMLQAQFDNGAWPQRYPHSQEHYDRFYTFNDNAINDCIAVMLEAWDIYGEERYLQSALAAGDFIIASQGDPPQAGWAQQYSWDMEPAPARKFEPKAWCPAVTSRNIRTLVTLYVRTGYERFLDPIPAAIEWLQSCKIDDDLWPRFVEVGSNKPLYYTKEYELVYTDDDLPTHYSFQSGYGIPGSIAMYQQARRLGAQQYYNAHKAEADPEEAAGYLQSQAASVRDIIEATEAQGRWLSDGAIVTRDFVNKFRKLTAYIRKGLRAR